MSRMKLLVCCAVLASLTTLATSTVTAAEKLSDILRESKWDGIIGTWVDAKTKGKANRTTFEWKVKDRIIALSSREGDKETASLIMVSHDKGIRQIGGDNKGSTMYGRWDFKEKTALVDLTVEVGENKELPIKLEYRLEDKDTMTMSVPAWYLNIKLIREEDAPRE